MGYLLKTRLFLLCIFLFGLSGQISFAQNVDLYPEKSVRIIVPYPPGDLMTRWPGYFLENYRPLLVSLSS